MEMESIFINAAVTIFSLGLLLISLVSYKKHKNPKLLYISFVFIVLLIKGIMLSISLFYQQTPFDILLSSKYSGLFDLIILILLFIATLKR